MTASTATGTTTSNPALDLTDYQKNLAAKSKSTATTTSSSATGSSTLDKNSFMKLMVTQLKYQDPLNPSDNQQMAAQMAQFSSLEALQNMQTSLTDLAKTISDASAKQTSATEGMSTASATALLGQTARLKKASLAYTGSATDVSVHASAGSELQVLDAKGNVVRTLSLDGTDAKGKSILDVVTTLCSQNGTRYEHAVGEAFDEASIGCQQRLCSTSRCSARMWSPQRHRIESQRQFGGAHTAERQSVGEMSRGVSGVSMR